MDLALYDEEAGYYTCKRERVGRGSESDFYTAADLQPVFGRLVAEATVQLLAPRSADNYTFLEIGAEHGRGVLAEIDHPFAAFRVVGRNDRREIPPASVVFSNELFDAQPFHRIAFRRGAWRELGVTRSAGGFAWATMSQLSPDVSGMIAHLPETAPEGYTIDLPLRAVQLTAAIAREWWHGLFIAFDYGRTWNELLHDFPQGTGRAYRRHAVHGDLLADPGRQDLTCHVCWDWIEKALIDDGFTTCTRMSQESFFLRHAPKAVESILQADVDPLSPARSQLRGLLHAGIMGQKFEVVVASRFKA